jgi:hypothetical protein
VTPLDLAVELAEEVVLDEWSFAAPKNDEPPQLVAPGLSMTVSLPPGDDGPALVTKLAAAAKKRERPRLYGTVHYEFGRLVFSPLSFLGDDGPEYILLSDETVKLTALLGSLDLGK